MRSSPEGYRRTHTPPRLCGGAPTTCGRPPVALPCVRAAHRWPRCPAAPSDCPRLRGGRRRGSVGAPRRDPRLLDVPRRQHGAARLRQCRARPGAVARRVGARVRGREVSGTAPGLGRPRLRGDDPSRPQEDALAHGPARRREAPQDALLRGRPTAPHPGARHPRYRHRLPRRFDLPLRSPHHRALARGLPAPPLGRRGDDHRPPSDVHPGCRELRGHRIRRQQRVLAHLPRRRRRSARPLAPREPRFRRPGHRAPWGCQARARWRLPRRPRPAAHLRALSASGPARGRAVRNARVVPW